MGGLCAQYTHAHVHVCGVRVCGVCVCLGVFCVVCVLGAMCVCVWCANTLILPTELPPWKTNNAPSRRLINAGHQHCTSFTVTVLIIPRDCHMRDTRH